jgi:hypothetical protein
MRDRTEPKHGEIYKHFKNKTYQIVDIAIHSETKEKLVIYQALYDDYKIYARPLEMFMSEVDHEKYPNVIQKYRFELCSLENENPVRKEEDTIAAKGVMQEKKEKIPSHENCLIEFLDAETYEQKREIFLSMKKIMNTKLIYDIATSLDVEVEETDIDTQFKSLLKCLDTMVKYESNRLR